MISRSKASIAISVTQIDQAGEARRAAIALAWQIGFDETQRGKLAIIVTEAAKNVARHATQGQLILQTIMRDGIEGIEILVLDKGPGLTDIGKCLRDGYSTGSTPGTGLGAIARLSSFFDVYSQAKSGTVMLARLWPAAREFASETDDAEVEVGAICVPKNGEPVCGDAWTAHHESKRSTIMVIDGLGHGPEAAQAAQKAVHLFHKNTGRNSAQIIQAVHQGLRGTRGAAIGLCELDLTRREIRFTGTGNVSGVIFGSNGAKSMVSIGGIAGHRIHGVKEFTYPWPKGALVVMYSDGLSRKWSLDDYTGLRGKHPSLIAGALYRDFGRQRDDVTVLAVRHSVKKEIV